MHGRLVLAVVATGCYAPADDRACEIACEPSGDARCPSGLTCVPGAFFQGGLCVDPTGDETCAIEPAGKPFSDPVGFVSTTGMEDDPTLTGDQLELYVSGAADILVFLRSDAASKFEAPVLIAELDDPAAQLRPSVSLDGLTLLWGRRTSANEDILISRRSARSSPWSPPKTLPLEINTPTSNELPAWVSSNGSILVFETYVGDIPSDLYLGRDDGNGLFALGEPLSVVNTEHHEGRGGFDETGTIFMFESDRDGELEIWEAYLGSTGWTLRSHPELNSARGDGSPWVAPDGRSIVFSSNRSGDGSNIDLFQATR